jgi:iron complex transport system ATP-binding protein
MDDAQAIIGPMSLLSASNLAYSYGDQVALRDVSFSLRVGEILALAGPNGSGKSTLIKVLLGQLAASGEIAWDERPIAQWRRRELARFVAYLPQAPTHEPGQTVLDVLRLGRAPYWGAFGLESSADEAAIARVAHMLGLDSFLGRRMEQLSGGQRQRVFIGRCLAQQPKALLLDEPSTFLDLAHQVELCRLLADLARTENLAVLMASHELNVAAAFADRLMLLSNGAIAAEGTADAVLRPQVLEPVYGIAIARYQSEAGKPLVVPKISN